jgi:hypothetical protein
MEPQFGDRLAEGRLEMVEQVAEALLRLADREVAVRLAGARDRVRPDRVRVERQTELAGTSLTPVTIRFCWRVSRMSPPNDSTRSATAISWSPDVSPSCTGTPMNDLPSFCGCTPMCAEGCTATSGSS